MSDAEKPTNEPQDRSRGERPSPRNRPQKDKPLPGNAGKVPALDDKDLGYGFGSRVTSFEAEIANDLERDLKEAFSGMSDSEMKQLYGEAPRGKAAQQSGAKPRKGKVMAIRGKDVFIDVGGRIQGVLPVMQFEEGVPEIGTEVEVSIEGHDPDGLLILARTGAVVQADWNSVAPGMIVEARVTGVNKGGLSVEVNGIRGFMPISQIEMFRIEDLNPYVNMRLRCMVTEVDREDRNLLVSRRAMLEVERDAAKEQLWTEIGEGQIREGVVRLVKPFGAFIDLGGADGLLPVGEMSWQRVKDPLEVVQPGQRVRVIVLRVDHQTRKLTLGLRQLTSSPWDQAGMNYPIGTVVKGTVSRITDFGAFVELEPGVEGLVHISEVATQRVSRIDNVIKVGQEVNVKVLNLDIPNRRMSLSIKGAVKAPEPEAQTTEPEVEEEVAPPPVRKYNVPLRGGVGGKMINLPKPPSE